MVLKTRWHKIINDIIGNKNRSILVIASIAVGIGVVGIINNAKYMIEDLLYSQYAQGNPASVSIYTSPFESELVEDVLDVEEAENVEARRVISASIHGANDDLFAVSLIAVNDFSAVKVNQLTLEDGSWQLDSRQLALEKQTADALGVTVGDQLTIEMNDGTQAELTISAIMGNIYEMPFSITNQMTAFVSIDTLEALGEIPVYNRLDIVIGDHNSDRDYVLNQAAQIRDEVLQPNGVFAGSIQIPGIDSAPGEHWAQNQISGFVLILQVMSVMAIFLSGGLVVNTITAILTQQVKQIGIMRSIGAIPTQITGMFVFNVMVYSLIGWLFAIPISIFGSYGLTKFAAGYLNFKVNGLQLAPEIFTLLTVLAFFIPLGVAFYPILAGTRIKIYDAIYQQGLVKQDQKPWLEKLLLRLKFLNPASVLSILNTFRNVPRLGITLLTLVLAGATFVAAFSTRASLNAQIEEFYRYAQYDAAISVSTTEPIETVVGEAEKIPGVVYAEGWAQVRGTLIKPDNSEGGEVKLVGLSPDSQTVDPLLVSGRWLEDSDLWQVVLNEDLVNQEGDLTIGSIVAINIMGKEHTLEVVGIASKHLVDSRIYINYPTISEITGQAGGVDQVRIRTDHGSIADRDQQESVGLLLEDRFTELGYTTAAVDAQHSLTSFFTEPFNIILIVLVVMAGLLAVVGGLSLAGTMGINVMERTREIGVLRSVGASNGAIQQVVALEGVMIAFLSWLIVVVVSSPFSAALAGAVILAVLNTSLTFSFSFAGLFLWLGIIVLIGVVSSLTPARSAVRLTVREVLDYD